MTQFRVYGAVILSMIFWSFSFIWFKEANRYFGPITIVFFRLITAVVILTGYLLATRKFMKIKKKDRKLFFLLALFEPFFYFLGESHGLTYVSPTTGSVIISTIPVIATVGAWLFFRERLSLLNYTGIMLSFLGIIAFVINRDGSLTFSAAGLGFLGIAVISAVGYNLVLSSLVGTYSPVYIVNVQNVIGAILFLPVFLLTELRDLEHGMFSFGNLFPVLELSLFASCGAFILFAFSVRHMGISKANVFTNCIPVFTGLFSFLLFSEKLTFQQVAGMVIVITGLFLSQRDSHKKNLDEASVLTGKTA